MTKSDVFKALLQRAMIPEEEKLDFQEMYNLAMSDTEKLYHEVTENTDDDFILIGEERYAGQEY